MYKSKRLSVTLVWLVTLALVLSACTTPAGAPAAAPAPAQSTGQQAAPAESAPAGEKVLELYEEMASECLKATKTQWRRLQGMLNDPAE